MRLAVWLECPRVAIKNLSPNTTLKPAKASAAMPPTIGAALAKKNRATTDTEYDNNNHNEIFSHLKSTIERAAMKVAII